MIIGNNTNGMNFLAHFLCRYEIDLEESMKCNDFAFDRLYDSLSELSHCVIVSVNCIYIHKKSPINPKISDGNCFQYTVMVALNFKD